MRLWPFGPRSRITRTRDELIISIPAPCNIFILLFVSVWLVAWAAAEIFVPWQILTGEIPLNGPTLGFMLAWFAGWTAGGALGIYAWLWMVRGREIVRVRRDVLGIRRSVWSRGVEKQFPVEHISDLRLIPEAFQFFGEEESALYNWLDGPLAFDYGDRTLRFGKGLRKAEAQELVEEISEMMQSPMGDVIDAR